MSINLIRNCDKTIGRMRKGDVDLVCVLNVYIQLKEMNK